MTSEELHGYARDLVGTLQKMEEPPDLDKKQLRFNDIVRVALAFYPTCPKRGVTELILSTNKRDNYLYIKGSPMWKTLEEQYSWMLYDTSD